MEQKNITIDAKSVKFIKANFGKMPNTEIFKHLGITQNKYYQNIRLMGLKPTKKVETPKDKTIYFQHEKLVTI
jgi:hypothetical protein